MFWRDAKLWLAILVAPLFWVLLAWLLPLVGDSALFFTDPWFYFQLVLLYPLLEEIVFRGVLQGYLSERLAGRRIGPLSQANLLTSVVFSLMHWIFRSGVTALLVFLPSLIFGYFKDRYGSLRIPIALHCYYNAGFYFLFVS